MGRKGNFFSRESQEGGNKGNLAAGKRRRAGKGKKNSLG